jgi:hypothetical protein
MYNIWLIKLLIIASMFDCYIEKILLGVIDYFNWHVEYFLVRKINKLFDLSIHVAIKILI